MLEKNPSTYPTEPAQFMLDGPAGELEVLTNSVPGAPKGLAIICHPHPLHQGSMQNKVVHTLARAFTRQGLLTVRFNFRGVGASEGQFAQAIGEIDDLMAVIDWAQRVTKSLPLFLAGFSFGAYIAAKGATQVPVHQLFSVAPAVTNNDFSSLAQLECPWVVVQGEQDEVIEPLKVFQWFEQTALSHPKMQLVVMPEASHFFHGQLVALGQHIEYFLSHP
jgi:alpha/beta superfamily hydrolase